MNYWKVYCMEDRYPGLWHTWFTHQVAAVGWAAKWGYRLHGGGKADQSWPRVRTCLLDMAPGDRLVVQLGGHRVGRVGTITGLRVEDGDWDPTVPPTKADSDGEQGRLIFVRWDLSTGPLTPNMAVALPDKARLHKGPELLWAVFKLESTVFDRIEEAMKQEENWVLLQSGFNREQWLSEHIAVCPHELESGMRPYPWAKVREKVFDDRTRSDVLLLDRDDNPVVVECKQDAPTTSHLRQLRGYMGKMEKLLRDRGEGNRVRGILVHGGPRKVHEDVRHESERDPTVELVRYLANVDFARST